MQFASNIKKLREERKLSQKDIAEYLGITRQAVNSYECGRREPDYNTLVSLADFFGVTVDFLLGRTLTKNAINFNNNDAADDDEKCVQNILKYNKLCDMDCKLLRWIQDENNIQYIKFARDIQKMELPLESIQSILDVLKSVQKRT